MLSKTNYSALDKLSPESTENFRLLVQNLIENLESLIMEGAQYVPNNYFCMMICTISIQIFLDKDENKICKL